VSATSDSSRHSSISVSETTAVRPVFQADHHRLAKIGLPRPHLDRELGQHLAHLHDRVRVVDLHHQGTPLQRDDGAADLLTL